ncbi:MAG: hypothetical protein ACLVG5_09930 [Clostridium sp.]
MATANFRDQLGQVPAHTCMQIYLWEGMMPVKSRRLDGAGYVACLEAGSVNFGYSQLKGRTDSHSLCSHPEAKNVVRSPKELILDVGENISGYISLSGMAKAGTKIKLSMGSPGQEEISAQYPGTEQKPDRCVHCRKDDLFLLKIYLPWFSVCEDHRL